MQLILLVVGTLKQQHGRPNPRIKDVLRCLKKEAENSNYMHLRIELTLEGKESKIMYMKMSERLIKYEENGNIRTCLKTI